MQLKAGDCLRHGTISIEAALSRGEEGEVYRVLDCSSDKVCALKVKHRGNVFDTHVLREGDLLTRLRNEHIIELYDSWVDPEANTLMLLTEYCNAGDMEHYIRSHHPLPEDHLKDIMTQLLLGLLHTHSNRVIHRDLKPANILLTIPPDNSGRVIAKLGDWGCGKRLPAEGNGLAYRCKGTAAYYSPEMLHGQPYSFATDVWSLGVCFYVMMTGGRLPFIGASVNEVKEGVCRPGAFPPPPPQPSGEQQYSKELVEVVLSMLELTHTRRPSVAALLRHEAWKPCLRSLRWTPLTTAARPTPISTASTPASTSASQDPLSMDLQTPTSQLASCPSSPSSARAILLVVSIYGVDVTVRSAPAVSAPPVTTLQYGDQVYLHWAVMEAVTEDGEEHGRQLWGRILHPIQGYCILGYGAIHLLSDVRHLPAAVPAGTHILSPPSVHTDASSSLALHSCQTMISRSSSSRGGSTCCSLSSRSIHHQLKEFPEARAWKLWKQMG